MDYERFFRDLRLEDERRAQPFARTWARASTRMGGTRGSRRALRSVAKAAVILTVFGVSAGIIRPSARPPALVVPTSTWRSPTDFLLKSPGEVLLRTVPQLGEPLSDDTIAIPRKATGGVK